MGGVMSAEKPARQALRQALSRALRHDNSQRDTLRKAIAAQADVELALPCRIGDYTDFYTSIHHATAVGKQFRPDDPLLPNYKWVPIGYHGRASSIVASGQSIRRPSGQFKGPSDEVPRVEPTERLDFELELGAFIGTANSQGEPVDIG